MIRLICIATGREVRLADRIDLIFSVLAIDYPGERVLVRCAVGSPVQLDCARFGLMFLRSHTT